MGFSSMNCIDSYHLSLKREEKGQVLVTCLHRAVDKGNDGQRFDSTVVGGELGGGLGLVLHIVEGVVGVLAGVLLLHSLLWVQCQGVESEIVKTPLFSGNKLVTILTSLWLK